MSKMKIFKASAGSGKTYTLALEYIRELLTKNSTYNYRNILAVTFTKDATGEVKDRILAELYGLAFNTDNSKGFLDSLQKQLQMQGNDMSEDKIRAKSKHLLEAILHDYSRLNITTIDSFFQRVLRNLARELGTGSRFNLEMNNTKVLTEAVKATIEKSGENKQILEWLTTYIHNKLDEGKSWNIENEILEFSRCIYDESFQEYEYKLSRQLESRPKIFLEIKQEHETVQESCRNQLKESAEHIKNVLDANMLTKDDFGNSRHSINFFNKILNGDFEPEISVSIEKSIDDPSFWGKVKSKRKDEIESLAEREFIPALNNAIETIRVYKTSRMITRNLHQLGLIWDITKEIHFQNKENNRFMLSDTALFLNRMIDESDAPFIYEKIGSEIKHVMIDEFQDTSRIQWKNFKILLSNILARNDFSLLVGDVKQSIYRWRNGDWRILGNIENELNMPASSLNYNYRSQEVVVDFNNKFFTDAASLLTNYYSNKFKEGESPFLSTYQEDDVVQNVAKKGNRGYVSLELISPDDDENYDEAMQQAVLDKLIQLYEAGVPANKICILTRKNKPIVALGDYLASQRKNYKQAAEANYLTLVSNEAFQLNSSLALRIIIEAIKVISNPTNDVCKAQLEYYLEQKTEAYNPSESIFEDFLTNYNDLIQMPLLELVNYLHRYFNLELISDQSSYLFAFTDAVSNYVKDGKTDLADFIDFWNDELQFKTIPLGSGIDGVQAMTIHKSKGLQFHTVIVPYCDWKLNPEFNPTLWCRPKEDFYDLELMPITYTRGMNDTVFAEEYRLETTQAWMDNLNLLYVAFTRAETNLMIIGKENPKLSDADKMSTVSDLLQLVVENRASGQLEYVEKQTKTADDNPFLNLGGNKKEITFASNSFGEGKTIFRQSNLSREFLFPDKPTKEKYVAYGNIMHKLFEAIKTMDDIESAIDKQIFEGIIQPHEKEYYSDKIHDSIAKSGVEDWFSGKYRNFSEATILMQENGELLQKRPDRVLLSEQTTIIIDFKFGAAHAAHKKQVKQYMKILEDMGYPNVKGYIWYVETFNKIEIL
ncbi:UvrD-helicase domain-containing protein [Bacteroidales bacterium OttesenSCG-928-I14]|nr:UvrD-helicase domain-containing protein [Bacteroidales bacterium OttesenSCG-928-I14]